MARVAPRLGLGILVLVGTVASARAENDPVVNRGVQYLRGRVSSMQVGESALIALALLKAEVPANDPALAACIAKVRSRITASGYLPEKQNGHDIYEAAVVIMALANLDAEAHRSEIQIVAQYLTGFQKGNGSWDYTSRQAGDASISQYAVLGLWEAENAGVRVAPEVWDRAAGWYMSVQSGAGGWTYHRDEGNTPDTISMTAAGVGSLLICQRQLAQHRQRVEAPSPLLVPLGVDVPGRFTGVNTKARIEGAIKGGLAWLGANFTVAKSAPVIGQSVYYALYGIERVGALADKEMLGRVNWLEQGRQFIVATQQPAGGWNSALLGEEMNSVWAILFLTRSTAKTMRRIEIKRLGAGTLLGGRGLPKDLSSMTVAGGRVVSRPMNGAVEKMLAVLEDPRAADNADSALAGLVDRYQTGGAAVLRPYKDRFRKMLGDRDPGLRRVAAWGLGRTGDLDVVPALIAALADPDDGVMTTARQGLQLLSRKIDGMGPAPGATPAERQEAARRWRAWYDTIRPLDLEGQDDEPAGNRPAPAARSPR